ncbi:uncharacterized protein LOC119649201 isoform X3 [Hermetia illucens]|uniref:uncharacterized protein LOC119649201 isoform X3 n=1 Tax=Hermetia illucens TaxID=343691 RepID=UPI0018CC7843|nr:uncharacterized protein LOC119649201 isoform X3 [Hermetia illucens]
MASWAQRMHRRAADLGSVVTSCGHPGPGPYPHRLEKVKFGVALDEVCKKDIPGPLLVLILKLNKEAPQRENVFRAPGHQGAMKKLIHFLQAGRLVNVDNYSVYTIASVLKKFLRKIPNGIFGREGEAELFAIVELSDEAEQQERIHRLITSLPIYTQRLLVLLFGTFRVIASNAERAGTGMTSEALGVSVAPSFFQSCVSDGKTARMEDVLRFKVATRIMKQMIDQFATCDLFGRGNYEYYARVTGRILKVQDEWICSFQYPPPPRVELSLEAGKTWLQCECERWGLIGNIGLSASAESVHYPVKRPSRRGPSTARHHPHRSSSRRNKENGKSHVSTTVAAAGAVTTTICGAGSTSTGCRTTSGTSSGQHQQHRSNSFRQKKSNSLLTDCSSCTSSNNTNSKLRKPRAVSFESKETTTTCVNISNLMQNIKTSSSSNSDVIVEVMDTTPPPPEIIEPFHSQMSSASSTTISGTLTTPLILPTTTSPSTGLHETQHTSYMHFKPPRL